MGRGRSDDGGRCRGCGSALGPRSVGVPRGTGPLCPRCAGAIGRVRRPETAVASAEPSLAGGLGLVLRGAGLLGVEWAYRAGVAAGSAGMIALGGFVPVLGGWLRDEIDGWGDVVEALGGVCLVSETRDPDADLGPVLGRSDAPGLFAEVGAVARRIGARSPGQIRLSYLPCCGVVAWGRSRALLLGLPLLHVLTLAELRAVLAHELAHLARGDATRSARATRFVDVLGRALEGSGARTWGPLKLWASACRGAAIGLLAPIARGQEARADRAAAAVAGGGAAASALVKVALVQPLFREILAYYDPTAEGPNLYAFFRAFWTRLPVPVQTAMRHRLLADRRALDDAAHPSLLDRLAIVQAYPDRAHSATDLAPASSVLGDIEAMERMLHNRLFGGPAVEPSVFHRAGT
jgi:hypothetical protein